MHRRQLLACAAAVPLAALAGPAAATGAPGFRRLRPGDPAWPSQAQWDRLKAAVGGALEKPVAPLAVCEVGPAGNPACVANAALLRNPIYLGDQSGGTQVSGWLDAWTPKPSTYAVRARNASDVAAAVKFAREHRLRLVVKGGGHSYQGTSNAADSLLVFTRAMNRIDLHDGFVPRDCEGLLAPTPAVSVEAGAMWIDAYDAVTTKAGRYVQGGGCTTVGVAGHVQSGGFGSFSKGFGTAAGSLLEAEVVTADGRVRIVNARRDPELFWALKGGGGGSFGVITRVTLRTHALPEKFGWASANIKANSDAAYRRLVERFMGFFAEALMTPHWGEQAKVRPDNTLEIEMVSQGLEPEAAQAIWAPFKAWVDAAPEDFAWVEPLDVGARPARLWWDVETRKRNGSKAMIYDDRPGANPVHAWWDGDKEQVSAFLHGYESVWMPASLLAPGDLPRLADALFAASRRMGVGLHFNKGLAGGAEPMRALARDTAMNPAAVDAFALAIIATAGYPPLAGLPIPPPDMDEAHRNAARIDAATAELWKVVPDPGSYVSESNYFNRRWKSAFFGPNYPRLLAAKRRYDPEGLFFVHHGVGSDDWSADGFERIA
jgi:FAD/FMN-containing dehydrogenase